jgi:hypothetical protein
MGGERRPIRQFSVSPGEAAPRTFGGGSLPARSKEMVPQDFPVVFIVLVNGKYCILTSFAKLEEAPGVPELDIPNLDMVSLERG